MVSGAKTRTSPADETRTQPIWPAVAVPSMSRRSAVTRWLTGLPSTEARSQLGLVSGSTNTLLANVRGKTRSRLMLETALGVRTTRASAVQIQARLNENTSSSATAAR